MGIPQFARACAVRRRVRRCRSSLCGCSDCARRSRWLAGWPSPCPGAHAQAAADAVALAGVVGGGLQQAQQTAAANNVTITSWSASLMWSP